MDVTFREDHHRLLDRHSVGHLSTTVECLNDDERVLSVELSSQNSHVDCAASMAFIGAIEPATSVRVAEKGDQCLIGIIDADIDVLHADFREPDQFDAAGNIQQ